MYPDSYLDPRVHFHFIADYLGDPDGTENLRLFFGGSIKLSIYGKN